jgi:hypothetical protein
VKNVKNLKVSTERKLISDSSFLDLGGLAAQDCCEWKLHFNERNKEVDSVLKNSKMVDIVELDKKTMGLGGIFGETDLDIALILGHGVRL